VNLFKTIEGVISLPYNVRMRASRQGRHISGAEKIAVLDRVPGIVQEMLKRGFQHTRGMSDSLHITVEYLAEELFERVPLLPLSSAKSENILETRGLMRRLLVQAGVSEKAAANGIESLLGLDGSMRGAMLMDAAGGKRLDEQGQRGIRVSRMDIEDEQEFSTFLVNRGIGGLHAREALVLASKVAAADGVVAELCWSDDPEYTTGYVASKVTGYVRLPHCKPLGSMIGGRVFFVKTGASLLQIEDFLQHKPVRVYIGATK
jgi:6-carboxyhexanoate--CoA ligase